VPRYYFHIKDDVTTLDREGTNLADLDAARKEAVGLSGEVLRDGAHLSLWSGSPWVLWVTDQPEDQGQTLFTLSFSAVQGALSWI
jgi:hypothetical protein